MYTAPPQPQPQKSRPWLIIVIVVALCLCLCCLVSSILFLPSFIEGFKEGLAESQEMYRTTQEDAVQDDEPLYEGEALVQGTGANIIHVDAAWLNRSFPPHTLAGGVIPTDAKWVDRPELNNELFDEMTSLTNKAGLSVRSNAACAQRNDDEFHMCVAYVEFRGFQSEKDLLNFQKGLMIGLTQSDELWEDTTGLYTDEISPQSAEDLRLVYTPYDSQSPFMFVAIFRPKENKDSLVMFASIFHPIEFVVSESWELTTQIIGAAIP